MHPILQNEVDRIDAIITKAESAGANILDELRSAFPRGHYARQYAIMRACSRPEAVLR